MPEQMSEDEKWVREHRRGACQGFSSSTVYLPRKNRTHEVLGDNWSDARQRIEAASASKDQENLDTPAESVESANASLDAQRVRLPELDVTAQAERILDLESAEKGWHEGFDAIKERLKQAEELLKRSNVGFMDASGGYTPLRKDIQAFLAQTK